MYPSHDHMQEGKTALILSAERGHGNVAVSLLESQLGVELNHRAKVIKTSLFSYCVYL